MKDKRLVSKSSTGRKRVKGQVRPHPFCFGRLLVYLVLFSPERIELDDDPEKGPWRRTPWSSDFVWIDGGDKAPLQSRFKAIYNREGLYFAFDYESVPKPASPFDPNLPDACEIFLDPEGQGRRYLEYAVAPDGTQHQMVWRGRLSVRRWAAEKGIVSEQNVSPIVSLSSNTNGRLLYRVLFPWKGMANLTKDSSLPPRKGKAWRANFSRVEQGRFAGDYSWAAMGIYYMHHPGPFGWLVFSGEKQPLEDTDSLTLTPLIDDAYLIRSSKAFPLFSRIPWVQFPLIADRCFYYAVGKNFIIRLDPIGNVTWTKTRCDGLPQSIRSVAVVDDVLYVSGDGLQAGLASVDRTGGIRPIGLKENLLSEASVQVIGLNEEHALICKKNKFQILHKRSFGSLLTTQGMIECAAMGNGEQIVLGTSVGFEVYNLQGKSIGRWPVSGGILHAVPVGDAIVGLSAIGGLFRITVNGTCDYYPKPLRSKFERVFADGSGGCWASFTGGLIHIVGNQIDTFLQPLGIAGLKVGRAVACGGDDIVFVGSVPSDYWYGSNPFSSFLLTYNGKKWEKWGMHKGLPGIVSAIVRVDRKIFLSTNAGLFCFAGFELQK